MSQADLQKSFVSARSDIAASLSSLESLKPKSTTPKPSSATTDLPLLPTPMQGLPDILLALLRQLRKDTTTLALAFKPPLTAKAVAPWLGKVADGAGRCASCVVAAAAGDSTASPGEVTADSLAAGLTRVGKGEGESVLVEEWRTGVVRVTTELDRLLAVLQEALPEVASAPKDAKTKGDTGMEDSPYLAHTGMLWDAVDTFVARLPRSELEAVKLAWAARGEVVKDAWDEFKEFLEEQEGDDEEDEDEEDDFGDDDHEWADLENAFSGSGKLSKGELKRVEAAKPVLAFHQILYATVPRYLDATSQVPAHTYQPLMASSIALQEAFDTAVAAMYPKHDVAEIRGAMDALDAQGRALAAAVVARLNVVEHSTKSNGGEDKDKAKRDMARSFIARWESGLDEKMGAWGEAALDVGELADAL